MIAVRVFSNADEVEIFVNGISFGKKIIIGCIANWEIPYQAGELKAVAYDGNQIITEAKHQTSSTIHAIRSKRIFEGKEYSLFALEAVDDHQRFVPTANNQVTFLSKMEKSLD